MNLSVVISAYNEEKIIEGCLKSVLWAGEIIVVDNQSTDRTVQVAKKYTKKIYSRPNNPMLNINKNYGFKKAKGEWILSLDADERVAESLKREIKKLLNQKIIKSNNQIINGYWIPRKNIIFGKWIKHTGWYPDYQLRLFRKGKGKFPEKHVHEMIKVNGETGKLNSHILHYNYNSVSQFIKKLDKIYTNNEAENLIESGYKFSSIDAIRFPVREFLNRYFAQKGYKDGLHGLLLSLLMGFYHLVVFAKIWEKRGFREEKILLSELDSESKRIFSDIRHWLKSAKLDEEENIFKKILIKLLK